VATNDTACSIQPYFQIAEGKEAEFRAISDQMVESTTEESGCLYYGFSFDGDMSYCREGYVDADALLAHAVNAGPLLEQLTGVSTLVRMEICGPAAEIDKLREPMGFLNPAFLVLESGFRR
jgi:hypothetical protein